MTIADDARALVARTCADQVLPETITDPAALAAVAQALQRDSAGPVGPAPDSLLTDAHHVLKAVNDG